ncbi:MFS transporter [Luteibacter aegosomaticola]|uniref:MFS transporter n=1 Tax=Luteibacter aegosomaticola TaxID=2911538 RepID=UPI001FFBA92E|nr:MFS transporter [Luteibacter aegosomaticola]UPG90701.1 MFS transporter [Luteibacter aegosomaticola]
MSGNPEDHAAAAKPFGFRFLLPIALGSCLNPINSTMIATALVPIATEFHAGVAQTGWLIAALYLCCAVAQPTLGRLADLLGARRVYVASLVMVMIAGLAGRVAPSLGWLVVVRVLLGIGTSGAYPSAMRLFRERADATGSPPPRTAMGLLSLMGVATAAVGPVLGGVLTGMFGWHAIFTVNVPLALITLVLVLAWIPRDPPRRVRRSLWQELDLPGIALFSGALLSVMVFLLDIEHPQWIALPIAAVLGALMVWHSLRRADPFIDLRMLAKNMPLSVTYLRAAIAFTVVYCIFYGFAQWVEGAGGYSAAQAGIATVPLSLLAGVSSMLGARTRGLRGPFLFAFSCSIVGAVALLCIHSASPLWLMAAAVALFGIPQGLVSVTTQAAVYMQAPAEQLGAASGLQRTFSYIGAMAATVVIGVCYGHRPTDQSLHSLAIGMAVMSGLLLVATLFDRTLPRADDVSKPHS